MKRLLLLCFLVFGFTRVKAQNYEIRLSGQRTSKPIPNFVIDSVIDLRYDKTNIGWVQKGVSNIQIQADIPGGLETELKNFLKENKSSEGTPIPIIVKINKLTISEGTLGDREYATAEVALEFLMQRNNKSDYCLLLQAGSTKETSSKMDVTGSHAKNLAAALEDCFNQANGLDFPEICASAVPISFLQKNSYYQPDPQTIPVMAAAVPKRGVYLTFQEFKNNAPAYNKEVTMNKNGNFFFKTTGKKVKDTWGFSDGKNAYIRFGDESHFLLVKKPGHFTFVADVTTPDNSAVFVGTLLGGIAGGLIASSITGDVRAYEFSLNPITGSISPIRNAGLETDKNKTCKVIIYRNNKSENSQPLAISVNDSLMAQLPANAFTEFSFKVPVTERSICVEVGQKYCLRVMPVLDKVLYYECSLPAKGNGKPILKPVTEQEAAYYLKIIKHNQEKGKK